MTAHDSRRAAVLITATNLHVATQSPEPPAILDVRWALGDPNGYAHYQEAHIPGARFVDLERELSAAAGPRVGRHPLPTIEDLQRAARGWGIDQHQAVVVYDATGAQAAARAWWLLRWAGLSEVHILDGGLPAWLREGFDVSSGPAQVDRPGDVELSAGHLPVLNADQAAQLARVGSLLDARAGARYRGEVEPVDPRAGHIPGAMSASTAENLDDDGVFRPTEQLRERFESIDAVTNVGVYCGSGVSAAHEIAALAVAGIPAALYPGSWSQWSADPARPAATGSEPG